MLSLLTLERKQTNSSNPFSNSHISLSFLLIWNWNDKYLHTLPYFPRKPYPIPDQNGQSVYPFSDQNGAKTLPDGAAHTSIAYIREYTPGISSTWRYKILPEVIVFKNLWYCPNSNDPLPYEYQRQRLLDKNSCSAFTWD